MGWAYGESATGRDIGYGVVAACDYPGCEVEIDRGLSYVCGESHDPWRWGCGGYFCEDHRNQDVHGCNAGREGDDEEE